jgi:tRNA(Ile)-lysidine synthase
VKASSPVIDEVRRFFQRQGISPAGVVVAVSGGPDSVALLLALIRLYPEWSATLPDKPQGPLLVAHLNHKLRGTESDADEQFVRNLHASLLSRSAGRLELRCESIDIRCHVQEARGNLESVARRIRYDWLAKIADEAGIRFVATGHTADDQAETVLFRLFRGTGVKGLSGIAKRRGLRPGVDLIRPLLGATRKEVLEYLEGEGQTYRLDRSNSDLRYTRNRIRHELIPQLARQYNPAIVSILGRVAEQAAEIFQNRESLVRELLNEIERPRAGSLVILDRTRLSSLRRHLIRELFHFLWTREGWPGNRMGFREWDRLAEVALSETTAVDLPEGIHARSVGNVVQIGRAS